MRHAEGMNPLSIDTVPLAVVPGPGGTAFTVHIDEQAGTVTLDPART
jgi:hypothetical protein